MRYPFKPHFSDETTLFLQRFLSPGKTKILDLEVMNHVFRTVLLSQKCKRCFLNRSKN